MTDSTRSLQGLRVIQDAECTTRDGTPLRADLYLDEASFAANSRLPTLVCRTPYGKHSEARAETARSLARKGYLVIVQDQRGRYASSGEYRWMWQPHESTFDASDGYDTIEWAAALPWSTGAVGAYGHSNDAWAIWTIFLDPPPSLVAASVSGIPPNTRDFTFGIFETGRRLQWIYEMAASQAAPNGPTPSARSREDAAERWHEVERGKYLWWLPLSTIPRDLLSTLHVDYLRLLQSAHHEFMDFGGMCESVAVPLQILTGWWDRMSNAIDFLPILMEKSRPSVRTRHELVVGPWGHGTDSLAAHLGPHELGSAAEPHRSDLLAQWFDRHMKGLPHDKSPVRAFVLGPDRWERLDEWPPKTVEHTTMFLDSSGRAHEPSGVGQLTSTSPDASSVPDSFTYDPRDPVMSLLDKDCQIAPRDQHYRDTRADVLVYETEPVHGQLRLMGPIDLVLWASTDAYDTDWTAVLAVVYPDGPAINISYGACRARYRAGFDEPKLLEPGKPEKYTIPLHHVGFELSRGQRLRLYLSSSDFPNFDRNHNVGHEDWNDPELRIANQTIFHEEGKESYLVLPVVPQAPRHG